VLKDLQVILAKTEVTYNTDPVPVAGTNAVLVENPQWSFDSARMYDRKPVRTSLAPLKPLYAGALVSLKFDVEIKGASGAGVAPELGPLLTACGMSETIVGATSVTYKPSSTVATHKSVTFYIFQDGVRVIITGARGKVSCSHPLGEAGKLTFEFIGHYVSRTTVALASPTYSSIVPVPLIAVPFLIDSYAAIITKMDWDLGNVLAKPGSIAAADGFAEIRITDRQLTGSIDPEQVIIATYDFINKWQTGAAVALDSGLCGSVAGNKWKVTMPAVTSTDVGNGDREGILTHDYKFRGLETASLDDELSLVFT
jgi:hypothetical protein